jgi:hypothetical protein
MILETAMRQINIVFDGPPGPDSGRFVEVEDERGHSIRFGEWIERADGLWALRFQAPEPDATSVQDVPIEE